MANTSKQYRAMLDRLLPRGRAWTRARGSVLDGVLYALAREFERLSGRMNQLIEEADPRSATETLEEWESFLGLPDECTGEAPTTNERRQQILERYTARGGISRADYIAIAAALGYPVTITEYRPFRAGVSVAGDPLSNGDWAFTWRINAQEFNARYFMAGSGRAGDPLRSFQNETLECVINKKNRASRIVLFGYDLE